MRWSGYLLPDGLTGRGDPAPVLTWLAGLTCTEETFMIKAGAQRMAAELGLMLVAPDTSPRGEGVPDDPDGDYDFGLGAGQELDHVPVDLARLTVRLADVVVGTAAHVDEVSIIVVAVQVVIFMRKKWF